MEPNDPNDEVKTIHVRPIMEENKEMPEIEFFTVKSYTWIITTAKESLAIPWVLLPLPFSLRLCDPFPPLPSFSALPIFFVR